LIEVVVVDVFVVDLCFYDEWYCNGVIFGSIYVLCFVFESCCDLMLGFVNLVVVESDCLLIFVCVEGYFLSFVVVVLFEFGVWDVGDFVGGYEVLLFDFGLFGMG